MRTPIAAMLSAICRRGSGFGMMVLEVAFGVAVVSHCVALGSWFVSHGTVPPGIELDRVSTVDITRDLGGPERLIEERARLRALPGVVDAAVVDRSPFVGPELHLTLVTADGRRAGAWALRGGAGASEILGARVLAGRTTDTASTAIVLTAALAHRLFPEQDPVGRVVTTDEGGERLTIAGVITDLSLTSGLAPNNTEVVVRVHPAASPWRRVTWLVRWRERPLPTAALTSALADLHASDLESHPLAERAQLVNRTLIRAESVMLAVVKVVAAVTLLGSLGMAVFLVNARRRQIGIMRALGATCADVSRYFVIENCLVTGVGILVGVGIAYALHEITVRFEPTLELSPLTLVAGGLTFWFVGMASAWSPARAAARIPPGVAR